MLSRESERVFTFLTCRYLARKFKKRVVDECSLAGSKTCAMFGQSPLSQSSKNGKNSAMKKLCFGTLFTVVPSNVFKKCHKCYLWKVFFYLPKAHILAMLVECTVLLPLLLLLSNPSPKARSNTGGARRVQGRETWTFKIVGRQMKWIVLRVKLRGVGRICCWVMSSDGEGDTAKKKVENC